MGDNDLIRRADIIAALELAPYIKPKALVATQEMLAREFIKHYSRMCHTVNRCTQCPVFAEATKENPIKSCWFWVRDNTEKAVSIVEQWAKEHPEKKRKTYAEDFFSKYPNCERAECIGDVIPALCRKSVYGGKPLKPCDQGHKTCVECWNEEMEDENEIM